MKKQPLIVKYASAILAICCVNLALVSTAAAKQSTDARVDALVRRVMVAQQIPGVSVALLKDDKLVFSAGYGLADVENSVSATAETVYRTASIAKTFTAVAVMQLAEQKKLDLDQPVDTYFPAFPKKKWPITARQLLAHTAGVRHYAKPFESLNTKHYADVSSALHTFDTDPLLFEPGTEFSYSTFGFNLLGAIVEKASRKDFADYLRDELWRPAGLSDTRVDNLYEIISHRARGYIRFDPRSDERLPAAVTKEMSGGKVYNAPLHDTSVKVPGGGLVSTAPDLVRFASAINRGKLLGKESVTAMWTPQHTLGGKETGYGLGWRMVRLDGAKVVGHSGGQAGVTTFLMICPEKHTAAAVMCNLQNAELKPLCLGLLDQVVEAEASK